MRIEFTWTARELEAIAEGLVVEIQDGRADAVDLRALVDALVADELEWWANAHLEGHAPGAYCAVHGREVYA